MPGTKSEAMPSVHDFESHKKAYNELRRTKGEDEAKWQLHMENFEMLNEIYKFVLGDRAALQEDHDRWDEWIKAGKPIALAVVVCIFVLMNALAWYSKFYPTSPYLFRLQIASMAMQNLIAILLMIAVYHRYSRKQNMDWETAVGTLFCAGLVSLL